MPNEEQVENIVAAIESKADEFGQPTEHIDYVGNDDIRRMGCWIGTGRDRVRVLASPEWDYLAVAHLIRLDERIAAENNRDGDSEEIEITSEDLEEARAQLREDLDENVDANTLVETYLRIHEVATSGDCEIILDVLDSYQISRCRTQELIFPYNEPTTTPLLWDGYKRVRQTGRTIREILLASYPIGKSLGGGEETDTPSGPTAFQ